ncbi:phosphatase regulatory subunit [Penicillium longicatenatum]|uniref:phosphatase regulatory subunit n=1 Tax=Penicillium longicatenatum TaxID=1561947 RepID=UPI002547CBB1|nr:phosphatase regulatory subunit [Penicillium longicatenatum]KAJ5650770.1 phosphatase regulatory subunit [Penicillium longicatenatum]
MPYTAPLKSLLAVQHVEFCGPATDVQPERPGLSRSASDRLQSSRSYSSTSYVRRHRRSPSSSKSPVHTPASARLTGPIIDPHASLRQSPPPLNHAAIPPGAIISPPESAPNSDSESPDQSPIKLEDLEAAFKAIEQRKEGSPERMGPVTGGAEARPSSSQPHPQLPTLNTKPNHLRLSKTARKISHSRSSTDSAISAVALRNEEALTSSPDDSDVETSPKPMMVRKKSGELVRPALRPATARRRPSSMPGTPVYAKAVHFDSQLEHIRHFLQLDRPLAVSAETSPVDDHDTESEFPFRQQQDQGPSWDWELRLANFPKDSSARATIPVRLERLFLSGDKNVLVGSVAVANLSYHKHVAARFTFDYWRTISEVSAVFCHDVRRKHAHDGSDRFSFDIKLNDQANLENKTLFICIRYNVDGQEYWDNNNGMNFQVDFHKAPKVTTSSKPSGGSRPALPRSRTFTGSHTRPQSMPPSFGDFPEIIKNVPFSNPFDDPKGSPLTKVSSDDMDTCGPPKRREKPSPQAFGNRYDFGASLTAAMRTKPPMDRTTLTTRARSGQPTDVDAKPVRKVSDNLRGESSPVSKSCDGAPAENPKPSSLVSSKPCLESSVYKELVDKYCFYGSSKSSTTKQTFTVNVPGEETGRKFPSATPSPPLSPGSPAPLESPPIEAPRESRARSPAALSSRTSPRSSPSPMSHRYPYHQTLQNGFMNDSPSSPVIRGGFDFSFSEMGSVNSFSIPSMAGAHTAWVGAQ